MKSFIGKNALITGGSSGIGLAIARRLVMEGANVWLLARRQNLLDSAKASLTTLKASPDQQVVTIAADVADFPALLKTLKPISDRIVFDFLFNCAGVAEPGDFLLLDLEKFRWQMDINYFGIVNTCRIILPRMLAQKSGYVINIASVVGYLSTPFYSAYGPTKMAVRGLTESLRAEYRNSGVNFCVVYPPDTQTPQLDYENQYKSEILKEAEKGMGVLDPDKVAQITLRGIRAKRFHILPGASNWLMFHASRLLGSTAFILLDSEFNQAEARVKKNK